MGNAYEGGRPQKKKIGLKVTGRGIVREGQDVYKNGQKVGVTCSGTFLPFLKGAYCYILSLGKEGIKDTVRAAGEVIKSLF